MGPKTIFFRGYNLYIGGLKPSFFMVLGSKGWRIIRFSNGYCNNTRL